MVNINMRKLSAAVAESRGYFDQHPERQRVDVIAKGDLGRPPIYFDKALKALWKELKTQIPTGVAKTADRWMVEVACKLMHKFRTQGLSGSELSQLINALSRLGCSPQDRVKLAMPPDRKRPGNDFSEFV